MWKGHLIICLTIMALTIPAYLLDSILLKKGGSGGFVNINLSGMIVGLWMILSLVHIGVSSLILVIFKPRSIWIVHAWSGMPIVLGVLLTLGIFFTRGGDDLDAHKQKVDSHDSEREQTGTMTNRDR